jgi:hypothetical protein
MNEPFHKRFDIEVGLDEAGRRFVERIRTLTWSFVSDAYSQDLPLNPLLQSVNFHLGERHLSILVPSEFIQVWDNFVGNDTSKCLRMTEAIYLALVDKRWSPDVIVKFASDISKALEISEVDLEISWNGKIFTRKGAKLLDDRLVNDPLHWLREAKYENVRKPFEKGLKHWMEANKDPTRYGDVVTDMYEAIEAVAKIVTSRDSDLAGNREKFASELRLPEQYKRMLKEYDSFANEYRHAARPGKPRKHPPERDTEAFMYMTGLFIRLATQPAVDAP